jgi:hypothetical protein
MKNMNNLPFNPQDRTQERIVDLENKLKTLNSTLTAFFLKGRLRTDRTAPTSSADVQTPDLLYDRVIKDDYEYILIDNAGTLEWRRLTASIF